MSGRTANYYVYIVVEGAPTLNTTRFRQLGSALLLVLPALGGLSTHAQAASDRPRIKSVQSYRNDISPVLSSLPVVWPPPSPERAKGETAREANLNPKLESPLHVDQADPVIDHGVSRLAPSALTGPVLSFDGIPYPGVGCNCLPPDTNGAVGATQFVQMVNIGFQVFNKTTGASVLGPLGVASIWSGFGGVCETAGSGDPVVLYDKIANRWLISQFAGSGVPTDECIAVSTSSDATGSYYRYGFHLGSNFFDYPHLGVWPDGYYMSMNVFNSSGTAFFGPQAFAFDRAKMLAGLPATFVTPGLSGASESTFLPSDLDGSILPPAGTGNPFVSFPGSGSYKVRIFHADFVTPANTTFNIIGGPPAAGFTRVCAGTRNCVPELNTVTGGRLDAIGDRLMFRLAYRKFTNGRESVVGNYTVSAGGVAAVRWFELRAVTTAPFVFQESTYQPDTTWRFVGSGAMDKSGDLAIGFSASSEAIDPQVRYAGRLRSDPLNTLAQGEAVLVSGGGSQTSTSNRWGDYSALTIDPVDDCTFWYTQEYYAITSDISWKTRIGSFQFAGCSSICGITCDDENPCTTDVCDPVNGCVYTNNTGSCEDGNACTTGDTCSGGTCHAGAGTLICNDGNPCTDDSCVPAQGCHYVNNFGPCNDGNACTIGDSCQGGQCASGAALVCNDGNVCTTDTCNPATGCVFASNTNGCDDGNACTASDACSNGSCHGTAIVCDDANVCTTDSCNPATGCVFTNNQNACDDGNPCTLGDFCGPQFAENFDGVTAPILPSGWASSVFGVGSPWVTQNATSDTPPNSAFGLDSDQLADEVLDTPPIAINSASAKLTFRNRWSLDGDPDCFDASVLEIKIGAGSFVDILAAGGSFLSGGYTGTANPDYGNPLANRAAWCTTSPGYPAYVDSAVALPAAAAGQTIRLRWRLGSDTSSAAVGQDIDSIAIRDPMNTCRGASTITAPAETTNLTAAANKTTYNWSAAAFATRYDVVRGSTAALPVGPGGGDEVCFDNLLSATLVDAAVPSAGGGFWYLSRGQNACGDGTFGNSSNGSPRSTTTCP